MDLQTNAVLSKMTEADVTQNLTSTYASNRFTGCGGTAISLGLRGGFSTELFQKLISTLDELIELRRRCHPIPIDMRRVQDVLQLLNRIRRGEPIELTPLPAPPPPPAPQTETIEIDTELVAAVLTGDYEPLCERRGWTKEQLKEAIAANAAKMKNISTGLSASYAGPREAAATNVVSSNHGNKTTSVRSGWPEGDPFQRRQQWKFQP